MGSIAIDRFPLARTSGAGTEDAVGRSTRTTSAPKSARIIPAMGPGASPANCKESCYRSDTLTPSTRGCTDLNDPDPRERKVRPVRAWGFSGTRHLNETPLV